MKSPGDSLISLASQAKHELLLAAPFIKEFALKRVLDSVPRNVAVLCITRWEPIEILAGVSDLEVWNVLRERPLAELRLRMSLHAKFYRADEHCLVGSANITRAALGWSQRTNLELLVSAESDTNEIAEFEQVLRAEAVVVDQSIYETTRRAVDAMREAGIGVRSVVSETGAGPERSGNVEEWVPSCRAPDRLFDAYKGRGDRMLSSAFEDARRDLSILSPPPGLNRNVFNSYIVSLLEQHPIMRQIDEFVSLPRRSLDVIDFISNRVSASVGRTESPAEIWDVVKLWLLAFFPDRYRTKPPDDGGVFVRGRQLG